MTPIYLSSQFHCTLSHSPSTSYLLKTLLSSIFFNKKTLEISTYQKKPRITPYIHLIGNWEQVGHLP
ncbi:hypothetical protein vseg_000560 [Gypsophila vaccaria]